MFLKNLPIRRKLMTVILMTCGVVLVLTCTSFFAYEFFTFRQATMQQLSTVGEIVSANSTAALAFDSPADADEILMSLQAERHIVSACLYNNEGKIFSRYPKNIPENILPVKPEQPGYHFEDSYLEGYQPVIQGNKTLGMLYLKSDMGAMYERFRLYGIIAAMVVILSFLIAYLISNQLQRRISQPILSLAETAQAISKRHDYSVRATKQSEDEVGVLTDAFNYMLTQIQKQNIELNDSSARMIAMLNSALSAVVVMNAEGRIIDWNARAEKMFGWSHSEALGLEVAETIIPPHYRSAHRNGMKFFFETGTGPVINQLLEITAIRRDGSEFPVELSISSLKSGDTIAFCGFITDITDRKRAEEEIKSFNQQLEHKVTERTSELEMANKELEAFSYSVSHDLRAPLRSIHGYMNIFAEDYAPQLDEEAQRLTAIVLENAKRMGQLIDDLLEFSRLGRKELKKTNSSMKEMAEGVLADFIRMESHRRIHYVLHDIPVAFVDHGTMRQVWINLISNSIKYSRNKPETRIEIGAREEGTEIVYYVKDNGAGFNMLYYDKLFGVFQRLHSTMEFEGTGVGLAIVQRILAKHDGRIWAEAVPDEGATFYFALDKVGSYVKIT